MSGPTFRYSRVADVAEALARGATPDTAYLAGGTDFLQLWKAGVAAPAHVVDISRLPLRAIVAMPGRLTIGALARLGDVAADPAVSGDTPLIAEAILASASGQLRNMATVGGNLLQRTRCPYFRDPGVAGNHQNFACNKRAPGSGCGARAGENRQAALFGASHACVATHASDLAVALVALDAEVDIQGPGGERHGKLHDLFRQPGDTPHVETDLAHGDLLTAVIVKNGARFAGRSTYLKVRDRAAFEFAVVSVAGCLRLQNGVIAEARLAAGGVATRPWRLAASEDALIGRPPTASAYAEAAALAVRGARPLAGNGFKVELLRRAVLRVLQTVGDAA